jgi:hypothetical protein
MRRASASEGTPSQRNLAILSEDYFSIPDEEIKHLESVLTIVGGKIVYAVRALTEGLRMEHRADNIRCTIISPGAVATELPESSSEEATRKNLREFYKLAIPADSIARAISYAIEQPADVEIGEIVIRPTAQDF